ncbi:MAG: hypothetical protein FJW79_10390 [Actinobacteria bacterium]|nr:hypothetical protein [Actinomycetota bacterium]
MRLILALVLAVAPALLLGPAPAATALPNADGRTLHVAPGGSDAGAGTAADPWSTIQHAVDRALPGDTVLLAPGTYAGARLERSGAPGAWITLRPRVAGTAVVDRPGLRNRHGSNLEMETWEGHGTVAYWAIEGLEVRRAPSWGIDVRGGPAAHSHHIIIRGNRVHHNGLATGRTGIFFAFTDRVWVVGNHSHHNGEHGVYLSNSGDHFVVRDNRLEHNAGCGLHVNGDASAGGDGTISHGLVARNLIRENGSSGGAGINFDGVTDTVVAGNVLADNHATGIALFRQDGAVCTRRVTVAANTVVQAADGRWALLVAGIGCRDITVGGNVLLTRHSWRGSIALPSPGLPGFASDHNVVTGRLSLDGGDTVIGLAAWRTVTGNDATSVASTPGAALLAGRYRHRPGGPAEDAGTPAPLGLDFEGVRRPAGGAWDAGAFETPWCGGGPATLVGTPGADDLIGTAGPDRIAALGGDDLIRAGDGDDAVCGGPGNDTLKGGAGDDRLFGGTGTDSADGGPGVDYCRAESVLRCERPRLLG